MFSPLLCSQYSPEHGQGAAAPPFYFHCWKGPWSGSQSGGKKRLLICSGPIARSNVANPLPTPHARNSAWEALPSPQSGGTGAARKCPLPVPMSGQSPVRGNAPSWTRPEGECTSIQFLVREFLLQEVFQVETWKIFSQKRQFPHRTN